MRMLFVTPYLYPEGGGVGRFAFHLAREMSKRHEVTIVCSAKENSTECSRNLEVIRKRSDLVISNTHVRIGLLGEISGLLRDGGFDLVQAFTPVPYYADMAALASKKHGVPFFLSYNTFSLYRGVPLDMAAFLYKKTLERFTLSRSRKIIFYNKGLSRAGLLPDYRDKLAFVNPGIDVDKFTPDWGSGERHMLYVGALNKGQAWKGVNYLLRSMAILKERGIEIRLRLAGTGNLLGHYMKMARDMKIEDMVDFVGFLDDVGLVKSLQESYFLVLPSYSNAELMAFVILEAFACGKPVVSTVSGGIPYIVDHGRTGLLTRPRSPEGLAGNMERLLGDRGLRARMGRNAFQKLRGFSWRRTAGEIMDIYESELDGSG